MGRTTDPVIAMTNPSLAVYQAHKFEERRSINNFVVAFRRRPYSDVFVLIVL